MRVSKPQEERKAEILDVAARIFNEKGYSNATIQDVINSVGIAKGTFYYHFSSKEALLDALIDRQAEAGLETARHIANLEGVTAVDKLLMFLSNQRESAQIESLVEHIEAGFDTETHLRSMSRTILATAPHLVPIIEQGIAEGTMSTPYPLETIDLILGSASFLFDSGLMDRPEEDPVKKMKAFLHNIELILHMEPGHFDALFSPPEKA